MTNEEAIRWLEQIKVKYIVGGDEGFDECRREALDIAIEAIKFDSLPDEPTICPQCGKVFGQPYRNLVLCKDCVHRYEVQRCMSRPSDWFCGDGRRK